MDTHQFVEDFLQDLEGEWGQEGEANRGKNGGWG
jgi:hypothetical protein